MANNDSGGGCLLWFIDWIFQARRNKQIKQYNKQARGVEEYQSVPANVLFPPQTYRDNIIVSGGTQNERLNICQSVIHNAYNAKHPVIILHTANGGLENIIARNGFGTVANGRNKIFDAFDGFTINDIIPIVTDTCKSKYDIKPSGRYILQVAHDLLASRGRKAYFSGFANCPYFKLSDQITTRRNKGAISQNDADQLDSWLMTGQSECPKIDAFFCDMKAQIDYLCNPDPNTISPISVLSAIKSNTILCIDIRSSSNVMLVELIINSLIIAMNRGYDFSLLIDDITFANNDILKNTLCQKSNHRNIIVSKDLYALTGGKEDVFSSIIAESEKTVLFAHSSNISCDKLAKYMGEYEKIDVSYNHNSGWAQSSKWGYSSNDGQTETLKREAKVKPEVINRLSPNEAVVYDHTTGSLIQTIIT